MDLLAGADDIRDKPSFCSRTFASIKVNYQHYLDRLTPYAAVRWTIAISFIIFFVWRILRLQGFYIVTYALFIYYLNLFLAFLTPKIDPALELASDEEDGPVLPQNTNEEFRPFMRRLPEFKFWMSTMKSTGIAIACTFSEVFDIPVFWPILVMYFVVLTCLTMKRQIMHMIKYRYIPFTTGKPRPAAKKKGEYHVAPSSSSSMVLGPAGGTGMGAPPMASSSSVSSSSPYFGGAASGIPYGTSTAQMGGGQGLAAQYMGPGVGNSGGPSRAYSSSYPSTSSSSTPSATVIGGLIGSLISSAVFIGATIAMAIIATVTGTNYNNQY